MAESCKAALPHWLVDLFADLEEDSEVRFPVAVSIAVELCRYLMGRGVEEFHIYTLNRADLTAALCRLLRNDARAREIYIEEPLLLAGGRSEEHTSELQSLMRISYAVFCLKKKTQNHITYSIDNYNHNKLI